MISTLFILQIILSILIITVVLMQKSSSIGLGVYNSSNDSVFGAKGPAGFMAKLTLILGALFLMNTVALVYSYNKENKHSIINTKALEKMEQKQENTLHIPSAPKTPLFQKKD